MGTHARMRKAAVLVAFIVSVAMMGQSTVVSGNVAAPDDARIDAIFREGLRLGTGGTYGYFLKQVGGPALYGRDETTSYEVASEAKVITHLFGMRAVQSGAETLTSPVTVYRYPSLGPHAESTGVCAVLADEVPANAQSIPLEEAHSRMMKISDNRTTRALELRYGADNLNALISSLGMTATRFEAWPGCGVPGPRTKTSLADLGKLYESVSSLSTLNEDGRAVFYRLMNEFAHSGGSLARDVVLPEAAALGIRPGNKLGRFTSGLVSHRKGGGGGACLNQTCSRVRIIATDAGVVSVPFKVGKQVIARDYVFGTLIKDHDITCTQDPCEGDDAAHLVAYEKAMNEMLRPVIREALATFVSKKKRRRR